MKDPKMNFAEAKATAAALDVEVSRLGAVLRAFPSGPMGLTPDAVKITPEYRAAKAAFDVAFARLRKFNAAYSKAFAKEIRADRDAIRAARMAKA